MTVHAPAAPADSAWPDPGRSMHDLAADLYPLPRSLTGDGVRATLERLALEIPLEMHEVPSGMPVFDWTVPDEWNVREAWIAGPGGERIVDWADHNLHLVGYSQPVRRTMPLAELLPHLHTLPDQPGLIPYRTSYYDRDWGFCLPHAQLEGLPAGDYEVCIDATLEPGSMTWGECFLPGEEEREVLISAHVCHPSLANDNLSGIVVAAALARALSERRRRHGFRFVFAPATIGAIAWLAVNQKRTARIAHGLVLAGVGDAGAFTYERSRRRTALIDRAVEHVLCHAREDATVGDFEPYGYDERQYGSPGINLPVGCFMRTKYGTYPEYHTSADDLSLIRPEQLQGTLDALLAVVDVLERDRAPLNLSPMCEPQLGRRGLYGGCGGTSHTRVDQMALLWVLNGSDGETSLLEIAERAGMPFATVAHAADRLAEARLLA
jgi:aminopeptidase-like protein